MVFCFAVLDASHKHTACALRVGWLQEVASSWKSQKKTICFTSVSERTLGIFGGFFLLAFGYDIRWCPAVSEHHKSIQPVLWGLAGCKMWQASGKAENYLF